MSGYWHSPTCATITYATITHPIKNKYEYDTSEKSKIGLKTYRLHCLFSVKCISRLHLNRFSCFLWKLPKFSISGTWLFFGRFWVKIRIFQFSSLDTPNNMLSGAHADQNPVRCGCKICDTCPMISLSKLVILIDPNEVLHTIKHMDERCGHSVTYAGVITVFLT